METPELPAQSALARVRLIEPAWEHEGLLICGQPFQWDWASVQYYPEEAGLCDHRNSVCGTCWPEWAKLYTVQFPTCTGEPAVPVVESEATTHESS